MGWRRPSGLSAARPELHTDAPTVAGQEFDAGGFESVFEDLQGRRVWGGLSALEIDDGKRPHAGPFGQFLLGPFEETASGSALSGCDHRAI